MSKQPFAPQGARTIVNVTDAAAQPDNAAAFLACGRALEQQDRPADALAIYRAGREAASRYGDLMPLKALENRILLLEAVAAPAT